MNSHLMSKYILLIAIILFGLSLASIFNMYESFQTILQHKLSPNIYPESTEQVILNDYPQIHENETSTNNYSDIWFDYPVFDVGSFKQMTNNLRYHKNPDQGNCVRADFCGALYHDSPQMSNVVKSLPPAEKGSGARVGYYRSEPNELFYSIPTNENILY